MGMEKFRRQVSFRGRMTVKASSSAAQFAGRTQINSNAASAVVSTSAVKSDSVILLGGPILTGAVAAVTTSLGITSVLTITDGAFFTIGWANGGVVAGQAVSVPWVIYNAG